MAAHLKGSANLILRILLTRLVRYGIVIVTLTSSGIAHGDEDAFVKWAASHSTSLTTVEPTGDFSDLLPLKSAIGAARVVALGENTHGAHEPLAFRNRLVHFLVEQMGFTAIALESGFTDSSITDEFVAGGAVEMQTVLREGLSSGSGRYGENRELIQWMRDYNTAAPAAGHHRIRFYGIDLTAGGRISGTTLAIDYALSYLSRADPKGADNIRLSLGDNLPKEDWTWGMLSPSAQRALDDAIPKIALEMAKNRQSLIAHSSVEAYLWAQHNVDVARQLARCERLTTPQSFTDIRYSGPVVGCRDQAMAANVRWVVQNAGSKGRVLVFAHNAHVMNWQEDGGHWSGMQEKPPMMGSYLRRTFGRSLLIIATSSSTTSGGLPTPEPLDDSIDDTLARVGLPKMLFDLRTARQDKASLAWLSTQHALHANISTHQLVAPSTAFDVLVFLGGLTPASSSSGP